MSMGDRSKKCSTCREPLPGRIPRQHAAPRCSACQQGAWLAKKARADQTEPVLTPDQFAEVQGRIVAMERRAAENQPLFEKG